MKSLSIALYVSSPIRLHQWRKPLQVDHPSDQELLATACGRLVLQDRLGHVHGGKLHSTGIGVPACTLHDWHIVIADK